MKIETGGKDLFKTETFLTPELGETVIVIDDGPEMLRFVLNFLETEDEKNAISMAFEPVDSQTLRFTLTNWNNPLGTTLLEPVEIGTYGNRKLFVLFFVQKAGSKGQLRLVTFSLYLGEEVPSGKN